MSKQIVGYIRVSTTRQGKSGLGLEAQREALARFAAAEDLEIVAEYVEVETGKGSDARERRPELAAALADARRLKCAVIVAKLDRLQDHRRAPWSGPTGRSRHPCSSRTTAHARSRRARKGRGAAWESGARDRRKSPTTRQAHDRSP